MHYWKNSVQIFNETLDYKRMPIELEKLKELLEQVLQKMIYEGE